MPSSKARLDQIIGLAPSEALEDFLQRLYLRRAQTVEALQAYRAQASKGGKKEKASDEDKRLLKEMERLGLTIEDLIKYRKLMEGGKIDL